jgi:hypothetical protein
MKKYVLAFILLFLSIAALAQSNGGPAQSSGISIGTTAITGGTTNNLLTVGSGGVVQQVGTVPVAN